MLWGKPRPSTGDSRDPDLRHGPELGPWVAVPQGPQQPPQWRGNEDTSGWTWGAQTPLGPPTDPTSRQEPQPENRKECPWAHLIPPPWKGASNTGSSHSLP